MLLRSLPLPAFSLLLFLTLFAGNASVSAHAQTNPQPHHGSPILQSNGYERGGGDSEAQEFKGAARIALQTIRQWRVNGIDPMPHLNLESLAAAIDSTVVRMNPRAPRPLQLTIDRCSYHPEMARATECQTPELRARLRNRRVRIAVTAINDAHSHLITVDPARWQLLASNEDLRLSIVLHEFLGIMELQDRSYELSFAFWRQLRVDRDVEGFKNEFRPLMRRYADSLEHLLTPGFDDPLATIRTLRATPDYDNCSVIRGTETQEVPEGAERTRCVNAMGVLFGPSLSGTEVMSRFHQEEGTNPGMNALLAQIGARPNRKLCSCVSLFMSLNDTIRRIDQTRASSVQTAQEFTRERDQDLRHYISHVNARRFYARANSASEWFSRATLAFNDTLRQMTESVSAARLVPNLGVRCPGRLADAVACSFNYTFQLYSGTLPALCTSSRWELQEVEQDIFSEIDHYQETAPNTDDTAGPENVLPNSQTAVPQR